MHGSIDFTARLITPFGSELPLNTEFSFDLADAYSLRMSFDVHDNEPKVWEANFSLLAEAFTGYEVNSCPEGDVHFTYDAASGDILLRLQNTNGRACILLPRLEMLQLLNQAIEAGFKHWQLPEISDEKIAEYFLGAE